MTATVISAIDKGGEAWIVGITCLRCGHHWQPRVRNPKVCPKCHNDWSREGPGQGHRSDLK